MVLVGTGSVSATGMQAIKQMGGTTIAQYQATAENFDSDSVDLVVPLDAIAATLVSLVKDEHEQLGT